MVERKGKLKNYTLSLNPDETDFVQARLKEQGMSLSGFVRGAINEFKRNLEIVGTKDLRNMTAIEFLEAIQRMSEKLKEDE